MTNYRWNTNKKISPELDCEFNDVIETFRELVVGKEGNGGKVGGGVFESVIKATKTNIMYSTW